MQRPESKGSSNEVVEHKPKDVSEVSIDCTGRASLLLEDHLVQIQFTLGHLSLEIVGVDRVKGKMTCIYSYLKDEVTLVTKLGWRMKFIVKWEGKKYYGHLVITSMTREILMDVTKPFPMTIAWFNEKSPVGIEFNQVTGILLSSRCREQVRKHYLDMEKRCIKEYMPRFQTQRQQGDYRNQDEKKKANFDLSIVSENIVTEIALEQKERSRLINDRISLHSSESRVASSSRGNSPLREGRCEHDEMGNAVGEIGDVHGILPKQLMLQDFFAEGGSSSGTPAFGSRGGAASRGGSSIQQSRGSAT